jgi:hypothetical protein
MLRAVRAPQPQQQRRRLLLPPLQLMLLLGLRHARRRW